MIIIGSSNLNAPQRTIIVSCSLILKRLRIHLVNCLHFIANLVTCTWQIHHIHVDAQITHCFWFKGCCSTWINISYSVSIQFRVLVVHKEGLEFSNIKLHIIFLGPPVYCAQLYLQMCNISRILYPRRDFYIISIASKDGYLNSWGVTANNSGPEVVPCGAPLIIWVSLKVALLANTNWF